MIAAIEATEKLNFSESSLLTLNIIIALMMFGVSLSLRKEDFTRIIKEPKAPVAGMITQFLLLPALTCLGTIVFNIDAELALGMILVAACPGGSLSNIMTWVARGNLAASISMTAVSSLGAVILTPLNFAFYANLNPNTRAILQDIDISATSLLIQIVLVLGIPIVLGMLVGSRSQKLVAATDKPLRYLSLAVFVLFLAIAFKNNAELFIRNFNLFFWLVVCHNAMALSVGWLTARAMRLDQADTRAVTLESGLQNSGLGLVIIFTFMPHANGMMLIAAFWGVWHLVSGISLSSYWARKPITDGSEPERIQPA